MLSVTYKQTPYAQYHYAECRYAECRGARMGIHKTFYKNLTIFTFSAKTKLKILR